MLSARCPVDTEPAGAPLVQCTSTDVCGRLKGSGIAKGQLRVVCLSL